MPYIEKKSRQAIKAGAIIETAGELNFAITCLLKDYMFYKGEKYQTYNDIIGALEGAKLEIYRRKVSNYEDLKVKQNGDVF